VLWFKKLNFEYYCGVVEDCLNSSFEYRLIQGYDFHGCCWRDDVTSLSSLMKLKDVALHFVC
jgi:hypothetical protein